MFAYLGFSLIGLLTIQCWSSVLGSAKSIHLTCGPLSNSILKKSKTHALIFLAKSIVRGQDDGDEGVAQDGGRTLVNTEESR